MAKVKFYQVTKAQLDAKAVEEGALYIDTDNDIMYVDIDGTRREIGQDTSSFVKQSDFLSNEDFLAAMNTPSA